MKFYKRYMGDYGRDTAHLSLSEHGAYALLLDHYYSTEQALPADLAALYRICRAFDKVEQRSVQVVADAFFPVTEDGLRHNERADRQIHEDLRLIETARVNGKKGGRPRKETHSVIETEPSGNPEKTQRDTQRDTQLVSQTKPNGKALQNPESREKKKQDQKTAPDGEIFDGIDPGVAADFVALRNKLRAPVTKTAMAGIRREAQAAGITAQAALAMCCERGWRGFKADWLREAKDRPAAGGYRPDPGEI